jgi:pyruvate dehydrogenase E2 component (dihydrolipoyllysine-residue acetyltransferase)
MPEVLRLPEIAANTTEALLAQWLVEPQVPYAAGDPLVTVETEKAAVDVEADSDGVLLKVLVSEGEQVAVGTPIAIWGAVGEPADAVEALLSSLGVGDAPAPDATADSPTNTATEESSTADGDARSESGSAPRDAPGRRRIFTSPLARRLAAEAGVDIADILGTGPNGRIRRRDVDAYLAATSETPIGTGDASPAVATARSSPQPAGAAYVEIPHTRMRTAIARRLTESKQTAPHFYVRGSARVDRLLALRDEVNSGGLEHDGAPVKVSVNDLVVKAVARAHTLVPALNVQWGAEAVRQFSAVDVSIAIATETGLVTPVVRGVDSLSISQLSAVARDLATRAREKKIQPQELEGGTISVSNLGMFGTEEFAAIINPPQAAILAVGAARPEAVVDDDGALTVGTVLRVTLAVDHRPVDGAAAAAWMRCLLDLLEHPARILA